MRSVVSVLLLFMGLICFAGVPEVEWEKTFGGTGLDHIRDVQVTLDGGYILTGATSSFGAIFNDAWLIKLDSDGNAQWSNTWGILVEMLAIRYCKQWMVVI